MKALLTYMTEFKNGFGYWKALMKGRITPDEFFFVLNWWAIRSWAHTLPRDELLEMAKVAPMICEKAFPGQSRLRLRSR